jgi:hypothetical protein
MPDRRSPTSRPRRQITRTFSGRSCGPSEGGHRLHEWFWTGADAGDNGVSGRLADVNGQVVDEFMATGAVVAGRGSFEPAGGWAATTTTASRSSSSAARSPASIRGSGRWLAMCPTSEAR